MTSGTTMVPMTSICRTGLRLMRPCVRGHVLEVPRHVAVGGLVQRDREQYRERVNGQVWATLLRSKSILTFGIYQTRSTAKGASEPLPRATRSAFSR